MSKLEEEFSESEKKRQSMEERKRRVEDGLPSVEEEALIQANAVAQELREPEAVERVNNLIRPYEFIEKANVEIRQLKSTMENLSKNHNKLSEGQDTLIQRLNDLEVDIHDALKIIATLNERDKERTKLETETLLLLNQYLKDWL